MGFKKVKMVEEIIEWDDLGYIWTTKDPIKHVDSLTEIEEITEDMMKKEMAFLNSL